MKFVTTNTPFFVKKSFAKGRYSGLSLPLLYTKINFGFVGLLF